jgi:hypothetical protein
VWAPLILLLAFADRFLNEWNFDSITAQIAMVSCSALTLGLAAWLKEYGTREREIRLGLRFAYSSFFAFE